MGNSVKGFCVKKKSVGVEVSSKMEGRGSLTEDSAFKALQDYYNKNGSKFDISKMFKEDSERFKKFR